MPSHKQNLLALSTIVFLVLVVSYPGASGEFWFDDIPNILRNTTLPLNDLSLTPLWKASLSSPATDIGRPVSMFSFALNSYFSEFHPFSYKLTNIVLHVINAFLLFYLSRALLQLAIFKEKYHLSNNYVFILALFTAIIWAILPINTANILYVIQRMNELSSLFVILGTLLYLHVRTTSNLSIFKQILYFCVFTTILLLAILSKENGALLPALTLMIEVLLWKNSEQKLHNKLFTILVLAFLIVIPGILAIFWLLSNFGKIEAGYALRDFTLYERLFTQPRVLFYYIQQSFVPEIYKLSLYHDDFAKSVSFFNPITTIISIFALFFCIAIAVIKKNRYPILFFGCFWFLIAHSLEASVFPLELVFEHRNYLPSFGLVFLTVFSLYLLAQKYTKPKAFYSLMIFYVIVLGLNSYISSSIRGNTTLMLKTFVEEHPRSARAHFDWARLNERLYNLDKTNFEYYETAIKHAEIATELNPNLINGLIYSFLLKKVKELPAQNDLKQLLYRLSTVKPHDSNLRGLKKFFELAIDHPELFSRELVESVKNTYLANPRLKGRSKAIFYKDYADYLVQTSGMDIMVLDLLTNAVNEYPQNFQFKLFLIQGLIALKQYHAVEQLLPTLHKIDKFNRYNDEIDSVQKILDEKNRQL